MKSKFSILIIFSAFILVSAKSDIRVLQSNSSSLLVEYNPVISDSSLVTLSSGKYLDIELLNGIIDYDQNKSNPKLPYRYVNVGVPAEYGNTIELVSAESNFIDVAPIPLDINSKNLQVNPQNQSEAVFDDEPLKFGSYGISRDLRIQTIKLSPVVYDPIGKRTKIYTKIVFRVRFNTQNVEYSKLSEHYLSGAVINFKTASAWGIKQSKLKKDFINSVLASGTWYRFLAPEEGIYRINRSELAALGIDPSTVDPRTIKIYNNGGDNLPDRPESEAPLDLTENAILVSGESDGTFNENDYILFYGRGINFWEYNENSGKIVRRHNSYTKQNYYWITSGGAEGKRIKSVPSLTGTAGLTQTSTEAFAFVEDDLLNLGKSGREYWGDELSTANSTLTYINSLNGVISGEPIQYEIGICNASQNSYILSVHENNTLLINTELRGYGFEDYYWGKERKLSATYNGNLPEERSVVKFSFSSSSSETKGYLNYLDISYKKQLKAYNDEIFIFSDAVDNTIKMRLFNFSSSNISVYDVTDFANVFSIEPSTKSGGEVTIQFQGSSEERRRFLAITNNKTKSISGIESVKNSNVHGISPGAEYIIISHRKFSEQAERLRDYRENESPNKLKSVVVYIDDLLNEFANGANDPAGIRNFIRYAYMNWEVKPFYVFLLGDGTYDYFDIEGTGTNYIPTYQTAQSLYEINSYPLDDYYSRIVGNDEKADIAIGRVNAVTVNDAESYVDKVIHYETDANQGIWRTTITLVADDGLTSDRDDTSQHTGQAEILATNYIPGYFNIKKLFLSKYPTVITGIGRRKPAVNQAIVDAVNNGSLILNYTGHGNPDVWAHENVFERSATLPQFDNDKYFFLTAATCDFGKYDNPNAVSGTEEMILLEGRGAIGVFSAARAVYSGENAGINNLFYTHLMNEDLDPTLGQAYMLVKQVETSVNDEKYHLFADPAIKLNKPSIPVSVDNINDKPSTELVQIKALSETSIKGSIVDEDGNLNSTFEGEGIITVFDSERRLHLDDINYDITEQGGIIFRGRVAVNNGLFETSFRVPKDISYENKKGKIVAYIFNDNTDGIGYTDNIQVGGTDTTAVDDGTGPEVEVYFDDISNPAASLVNSDFNLFVKLADETGLNTTGTGVGHKLEGIIDDDQENILDFSNYFIGDLNSGGKSGVINYRFSEIEPGEHKIKIKAWDVFNNPTSVEKFFTVVNTEGLSLKDVLNYPNPFEDYTTFTFQHNLNNIIDVRIKVYTIAGRMIKEIETNGISDKFVRIPWDGRDNDGDKLANGTYLYKLIVKSIDGEFRKSILGKLAVFH